MEIHELTKREIDNTYCLKFDVETKNNRIYSKNIKDTIDENKWYNMFLEFDPLSLIGECRLKADDNGIYLTDIKFLNSVFYSNYDGGSAFYNLIKNGALPSISGVGEFGDDGKTVITYEPESVHFVKNRSF